MFKRLTGMAILLICLLPVHSVFAGVVEEINKAREAYQVAVKSASGPADQKSAIEDYRDACLAAIDAHEDVPLSGVEAATVASALVEVDQPQRALDMLVPFLKSEEADKDLIGLAATASFALEQYADGHRYLERLEKTDGLYAKICFMEAMMNFQQNNAKICWDFIMRLLELPTFSGTQRVTTVLVLGQLAQELNRVEYVIRLMDEESRRPGLSESGQKEIRRVRRILWMVGRSAKSLDHIAIWLNSEDWNYVSMKEHDHVLCFFRQESMQTQGVGEFLRNLHKNIDTEIGIVGLTLLKTPLDVQLYKGVAEPVVDKQEIKQLEQTIRDMELKFPVGVIEEGADWLELGVKTGPQVMFVDSTGVVQGAIWPPFSPILISSFMKKVQPGTKQE